MTTKSLMIYVLSVCLSPMVCQHPFCTIFACGLDRGRLPPSARLARGARLGMSFTDTTVRLKFGSHDRLQVVMGPRETHTTLACFSSGYAMEATRSST